MTDQPKSRWRRRIVRWLLILVVIALIILFGILPIGLFGLIGNGLILAAWLVRQLNSGLLGELAQVALLGFALFGVLFSIYLTFLEPFVIGATWLINQTLAETTRRCSPCRRKCADVPQGARPCPQQGMTMPRSAGGFMPWRCWCLP